MIDINAVLSQALKAAVDEALKPLIERIEALENRPVVQVDESRMVDELNTKEWFWDKVNRYVDGQIEEAIDEHCTNYDHDQYDEVYNEWGCESTSEFARSTDIQEAISEKISRAVRDLDITVSIR